MRKPFAIGDQVRVSDAPGHTIFEIVEIQPGFGCFIRQVGLASNGRPYRCQQFDLSLLKHAITDEMLKAFSWGSLKAGR